MTSIRIFVFLLAFLAASGVAYHLEIRQLDFEESNGNETRKDLWRFDGEDEEQLPGICWVCKWIVNKVKKTLPRDNSEKQDEVKNKLLRVCDKIGFVKSVCKKFVSRSIDVLVEELSTNDDAKTTCVNLKACSHKSTVEDIVLEVMESMQRKNIL